MTLAVTENILGRRLPLFGPKSTECLTTKATSFEYESIEKYEI
uniref:Ccr4-not transcription complex, putative n=1 Tax=Arundo donax TaxID=35708 RepID=A0A0A9DY80_ARUDO